MAKKINRKFDFSASPAEKKAAGAKVPAIIGELTFESADDGRQICRLSFIPDVSSVRVTAPRADGSGGGKPYLSVRFSGAGMFRAGTAQFYLPESALAQLRQAGGAL